MFFMKRQLRLNVVFLLVLFVLSLGMLPSGKAFAADRPGKVKNVSAVGMVRSVQLSWKSVAGADGYQIIVRQNGKKVKTVKVSAPSGKSTVSAVVKGLKNGTEYTFKVCAWKKTGKGKVKGSYSSKTAASPFSGELKAPVPVLKSFRDGAAVLEWEKVEGATGYELYQKNSSGKFELIKKTKRLKHRVKNLQKETNYVFGLRAVHAAEGTVIRSKMKKLKAKELSEESMRALAASINDSNVNNTGLYKADTVISTQAAESYANYGNDGHAFSSLNNYLVWVNLYSQKTFMFERKDASSPWTLMWSSPCITGKMGSVTPYGVYKFSWASPIHYYSEKDKRYAQYLSFFIKSNWSVHTFMYPDNDEYEDHPETFTKGFMASEGCVRLPRKYAKSVFDYCLNTPGDVIKVTETGSTIVIH